MDSNWMDFSSSNYDNLNFLDTEAHENENDLESDVNAKKLEEDKKESSHDQDTSNNGNNGMYLLDLQRWPDFGMSDSSPGVLNHSATGTSTTNDSHEDVIPSRHRSHKRKNKHTPGTPSSHSIDSQNQQMYMDQSSGSTYKHGNGEVPSSYDQKFFTPLISPAMTPLESMMLENDQLARADLAQEFFTPLTSPAINPINPMGTSNGNGVTESRRMGKKSSNVKRPANSAGSNGGKIVKTSTSKSNNNSPVIKSHNSPLVKADAIRKSSRNSVSTPMDVNFQDFEQFSLPDTINNGSETSTTSTMYNGINESSHSIGLESGSDKPATPATLMNLKFQKQRKKSNPHIKEITFQTPYYGANENIGDEIVSGKGQDNDVLKQNLSTGSYSTSKTYKSKSGIIKSVIAHQTQFKLNFNNSNNNSDNGSGKSGNTSDGSTVQKKSSHRDAEKGRRDRMNIAIHDLAMLIPEDLTSSVMVPSKATTVELACKYIESLQNEIRELNMKLNGDSL